MSDTPRTDAYEDSILDAEVLKHPHREFKAAMRFARQLERELSARPEEGERLDAARYRHIKAKESSFIVMYYGSRILGGDKSRRQVLTPELDGLIDAERSEDARQA